MKLAPKGPPGRITRKARAFTIELLRLRDQGYTFEAIREALADAGVLVSNSTVRREVVKAAGRMPTIHPLQPAESDRIAPQQPGLAAASASDSPSPGHDARNSRNSRRGKETAEAFFSLHHSNPLFPPKETS